MSVKGFASLVVPTGDEPRFDEAEEAPQSSGTSGPGASPGPVSRRSGATATLASAGLIAVGFFWATIVLVIAIALVDKGEGSWWAVLIFGALPLIGLYRIRERLARQPAEKSQHENRLADAPGRPHHGQAIADVQTADHNVTARRSEVDEPVIVEDLTNREREILALLGRGRTNGQIAHELYISIGTVKSHTNSIFRKLGASNRTEAVDRARHANLI